MALPPHISLATVRYTFPLRPRSNMGQRGAVMILHIASLYDLFKCHSLLKLSLLCLAYIFLFIYAQTDVTKKKKKKT